MYIKKNMAMVKSLNLLLILAALWLSSCNKNDEEMYSWEPAFLNDGLKVSTASEQGMDPASINNTYEKAGNLDNIFSLLIQKNDYLIAEKYFNGMTVNDAARTASVTKSIVSVLAGIAIKENFIADPDLKLKDFFPEIEWDTLDQRKSEITINQILQMRSGYPWEEFDGYLETLFNSSHWIPFLSQFPLMHDPGTQFGYSNFTAHMMGIIIARSSNQSLLSFANKYLFDDMDISIPYWPQDGDGYYYGSGDMQITPRGLTKFGQLYLDSGKWNDVQLIPLAWIDSTFYIHSSSTYGREILTHIRDLKYGYLWWSGTCGSHRIWFAWGHGGQMVVVIQDLNMVMVATANVPGVFDPDAWPDTKAVMELVGEFISKN